MKKSWVIAILFAFIIGLVANYSVDGPVKSTDQNMNLRNKDNQLVNIFSSQDPRIRIVYFGFTRCPDVCPTSLAMLGAALKQLHKDELANIRPIFITLDPERDTPQDTQKYAHYFHPNIEGYAGTLDVTQQLASRYNVVYHKTKLDHSALNYTIDHSSYFYFLKPDGTLIKKVPHTLSPQPIILTIQSLEKDY